MGKRSILRAPSGGSVSYEEWRDEAACKGVDPQLFELDEAAWRGKGQENDQDEDQQELIAWGLQICSGCPVRAACKANSSELDRYWTTRGGQPPEGLFFDSIRPRYNQGVSSVEIPDGISDEECRWGHVNWKLRGNGQKFCETCRKEQRARRYAALGS